MINLDRQAGLANSASQAESVRFALEIKIWGVIKGSNHLEQALPFNGYVTPDKILNLSMPQLLHL